ncbi:hypothetical protein P43SY_010203 [Pythium insidiosum]|uniref:Uncharacterized protein n=1 Tax=Pythium insidiosum TaxID=114742 RepID=A0AAD5Q9V1_PYTIN|nr:hypothetical protein P43SY_010203 [Pythium insidiosum]KAJ0411340.1 hypothetical protein ATCC90586_005749 [Pythium insidiosum]
MEASAFARASLVRIYPDAREDSLVAAYALLVVAPLSAVVSRWLIRRGTRTTPLQVVSLSFLLPGALFGIPALYDWVYGDMSSYRLLQLSRFESPGVWARKYAYWRSMYLNGEMPPHIWSRIDAAYDDIYDEKTRVRYDVWGPGTKKMTLLETQCNVALFYILWATIMFDINSTLEAMAAKIESDQDLTDGDVGASTNLTH